MTTNTPSPSSSSLDNLPHAVHVQARRAWLPSLVWLIPILAVFVGMGLVIQLWMQRGPVITLTFSTAEGLEAGKTKLKFRDVDIGEVKKISVAPERKKVLVSIELKKEAAQFAAEDSRFWVVRPRIAGSTISGIGTLLTGAYIGVDLGQSKVMKDAFEGLEVPPAITSDVPGKYFILTARDMGSLDIGSPVYYRRIEVGQITETHLNDDGQGVTLRAFVRAPYDRYVTTDTRFWHASGMDLQLGANGVQFNTESLATILIGGVAFATPDFTEQTVAAESNTRFTLASSKDLALAPADTDLFTLVMRFEKSVRGLTVGAPIDFRGLTLGAVRKIEMGFDEQKKMFYSDVTADIYMSRFGPNLRKTLLQARFNQDSRLLSELVDRGLRGQLRAGNLLTGQLYIALDFFKGTPKPATFIGTDKMAYLPTIPTDLEEVQQQLADIVHKIHKVPFDKIGQDLAATVQETNRNLAAIQTVLHNVDQKALPGVLKTLEESQRTMRQLENVLAADAPLQQDISHAMRDLSNATRALKSLTDTLERNPESLLRGKPEEVSDQ